MQPIVPLESAAEPEPMIVKGPPVALPPSGEEQLEKLKSAGLVREEGSGDAPAWTAPAQTLRIVERDGKESVFEFGSDAGYLSVEWTNRETLTPWVPVRETSRFGIASIASLELIELKEA